MTKSSKLLVLAAADAELVLIAIQESKRSTYTPAQLERLPGLLRALGRYVTAPAAELVEELAQRQKESIEGRKRGRPPRTTN